MKNSVCHTDSTEDLGRDIQKPTALGSLTKQVFNYHPDPRKSCLYPDLQYSRYFKIRKLFHKLGKTSLLGALVLSESQLNAHWDSMA